MRATVRITKEIDVSYIVIHIPVRYGEEDIPNDFPLRDGDMWHAKVEIDTGKIDGWPVGKSGDFNMKVCDEGTYVLFDADMTEVALIDGNYVPNRVVPGEYGDYVNLQINEAGVIINWPKQPDVSQFFDTDE